MSQSFELKLCNALEKIFPHQKSLNSAEEIELSALYGEAVSFQAVYRKNEGGRAWGQVRFAAPRGVNVTLRRVRSVPGTIPAHFKTDESYITTQAGLFPDLLEPFDQSRLPLIPGMWQSIWVDIEVTPQAAEGRHFIDLSINTPNEEVSVRAALEVIPIELPPLAISHTRWFHADCLADYYKVEIFSKRHWEIIENFVAYAVRHGINMMLTPIFTPPLDTEIGNERPTVQLIDVTEHQGQYTFGFDKLFQWLAMCQRVGIKYFEMSHLFTQWGAAHAPKIMGIKDGVYTRLFGWETDAAGAEYAAFLKQMLPALTAKLTQWGVAENTFFHISDEPSEKHLPAYKAARQMVEPELCGFKIIDALSDYDFYKQGIVSIPVAAVDHIEPFIEGQIPDLWCYFCCAQSKDVPNQFFMQPSFQNRILGALLYKYDIAGFLHWGYNFYYSLHSVYPINPFLTTDADGTFPSGDAFIVYPGDDGFPLGSIRLMTALAAFNDLRALRLLELIKGREFVLKLLDDGLAQPLSFSCFPKDTAYLLALRRRVNEEIFRSKNTCKHP